jgi:predicted nucleic acid-binding protein
MASKVFADANLLLDLTLQRDNYLSARNIIQHGIDGTIKLYTTPAILHINAYRITKA